MNIYFTFISSIRVKRQSFNSTQDETKNVFDFMPFNWYGSSQNVVIIYVFIWIYSLSPFVSSDDTLNQVNSSKLNDCTNKAKQISWFISEVINHPVKKLYFLLCCSFLREMPS